MLILIVSFFSSPVHARFSLSGDHMIRFPSISATALAYKTLKMEILGFNFSYPLEVDLSAGPRDSLNYYLYSDQLTWETLRMDENGIPKAWSRTTGTNYWTGFIAWYALVELGHFLRDKGSEHLVAFQKQINWLEEHASMRQNALVWTMDFDNPESGTHLRAPWVSAHAQGLAISAMVRGLRINRKTDLLEKLLLSANIFDLSVTDGGIRTEFEGSVFYTEIPGGPVPGILDGFLTSLLGLYDLYIETQDANVLRLFGEGIEGLKQLLPRWDYRTKWSWYGCREYLSPPPFHCLNRLLLSALARLTGERVIAQYAERWDPANLSNLEKAEIYSTFLLTKCNGPQSFLP